MVALEAAKTMHDHVPSPPAQGRATFTPIRMTCNTAAGDTHKSGGERGRRGGRGKRRSATAGTGHDCTIFRP
eukprot:1887326-Pyramimonas_sp.AAC.1